MELLKYSIKDRVLQTVVTRINVGKEILKNAGAAFFFGEIITEADEMGFENAKKLLSEYKSQCDIPPLITSDFENGCGSMLKGLTPLPLLMSLGATDDEKLAYDYGKATALEACAIGANWTFSPVVDLNLNRRNPIVNVRSLGDNSNKVSNLASKIIQGMQENGLAACAKHFPGDGIDWRDQHLVTTNNLLSFEDWKKHSGYVFQKVIEAGVYSIMAGHITLPDYQKETFNNGMKLPATLSYELIQELLKKEMCFDGIVVTDAVNMGGFNGWYKTLLDTQIESLKAGCDMVLWPCEEYVDETIKAVENGYISKDRLDDAFNRIMSIKDKIGLFEKPYSVSLGNEQKAFVKDVQKNVAENSITLVRDDNKILPINNDKIKRIAVIPVYHHAPCIEQAEFFRDELIRAGYKVDYYPTEFITNEEIDKSDLVIYAMFSRPLRPVGFLDFHSREGDKILRSCQYGNEKTIAISFGSPYFGEQYFERASTYINAYSFLNCSVEACVKALNGDISFTNYSPVKIKMNLLDEKFKIEL